MRSCSYHLYFSFSGFSGMLEFFEKVFCCCCCIIITLNQELDFKTSFLVSLAGKEIRSNTMANMTPKQKTKTKTRSSSIPLSASFINLTKKTPMKVDKHIFNIFLLNIKHNKDQIKYDELKF